jgi:peptidoglycan/LPS O-acetylase OafA/YrhL
MFLIFIVPIIRTYLDANPVDWINDLSFFTRIDSIAMGCFFALNRQKIIDRLSLHWKKAFYFSLVILFLLPWIADWAKQSGWGFVFVALGVLHGSIANVLIAVVMMYSVFGPKGLWHRMLNSRVFNYVGVLSYSLYLWQQFYISERSWWITHFPQNIILIFLTAMFSYYIIEKPFLKLKSRFSSKKHAVPKDFPVAISRLNVQPKK